MNTYQYTLDGVDYDVEIVSVENNIAEVKVNGKAYSVTLKEPIRNTPKPRAQVKAPKQASDDAGVYKAETVVATDAGAITGNNIYAPLPGTVTEIRVNVGDTVKVGQSVVVLEAMKMQNNIESDFSGKVKAILVKPGDTVMEGAALVTISD